MTILIEAAGWGGSFLILLGYFLVSTGRVTGSSAVFHWINLFGAIGLIINSTWHGAYPVVALNVIWVGIALYALRGIIRADQPLASTKDNGAED